MSITTPESSSTTEFFKPQTEYEAESNVPLYDIEHTNDEQASGELQYVETQYNGANLELSTLNSENFDAEAVDLHDKTEGTAEEEAAEKKAEDILFNETAQALYGKDFKDLSDDEKAIIAETLEAAASHDGNADDFSKADLKELQDVFASHDSYDGETGNLSSQGLPNLITGKIENIGRDIINTLSGKSYDLNGNQVTNTKHPDEE